MLVSTKQVIAMRTDLNMRKGKMIAQGAHASLGAYEAASSDQRSRWRTSGQAKICIRLDSLEQLQDAAASARALGLATYVVTDAGRTEFKGVPTVTCLAIGPGPSDVIDRVTGELKLL